MAAAFAVFESLLDNFWRDVGKIIERDKLFTGLGGSCGVLRCSTSFLG